MTPALALIVAFAGVHGPDSGRVERQLAALLHDDAVHTIAVSTRHRATLARHGAGAAAIVQRLHVAGLIVGELDGAGGETTLRIVVYRGDGGLAQLIETPLDAHALDDDDLDILRSNLIPAVHDLVARSGPDPTSEVVDPFAAEPAASAEVADPAIEMEPAAEPEAAAPEPELDAATAVEADLGEDDDGPPPRLGVRAALGAGLLGRQFTAAPAAIAGYSSSVVPSARFTAAVAPTDRLALAVLAERSVAMSTTLGRDAASTSITRWEASAGYTVVRRGIAVRVIGGLGHRGFSIESSAPMRSPDSQYTYVLAGADATRALGRVTLRAAATALPVVAGSQPMAPAFGSARRWGIDLAVGATVTLGRVFIEATADYQRFQWSWPSAGERGAGGAVDAYPTAAVTVGASY